MKAWTPDTILELIELYRNRPVLWDHQHPGAKKNELKQAAWLEIAEIMNRADVEKKMNILIVQFRREMKKLRELHEKCQKGESDKPLKSKWFAFESMYFLKDKMRKQKQLTLAIPEFQDVNKPRKQKRDKMNYELFRPKQSLTIQNDQIANIETECDPLLPYETKDEYSAFGELVAIKIRKLPTPFCKNKAMNIITDTLFRLESEFMELDAEMHMSDVESYTETVYIKTAADNMEARH